MQCFVSIRFDSTQFDPIRVGRDDVDDDDAKRWPRDAKIITIDASENTQRRHKRNGQTAITMTCIQTQYRIENDQEILAGGTTERLLQKRK